MFFILFLHLCSYPILLLAWVICQLVEHGRTDIICAVSPHPSIHAGEDFVHERDAVALVNKVTFPFLFLPAGMKVER